jgi:N-acetylneuraminic acid mutarotase
VNVTVTDGQLTITSAGVWNTDKLNYLAIQSSDSVTPPNVTPTTTANIKWTSGPKAPVPRTEPESAVVGDKLYVFSGYGDTSGGRSAWVPSATIDKFDPKTNTWSRVGSMPLPTTHAAVSVVGTDVWFAGGYTLRAGTLDRQDIATTNVWIYHTTTNTWTKGPALPARRASGGLGLVNNKLYFISGEPPDHTSVTTNTWVLDLANQSAGWKSVAPIPQGRTHFGTAVVNNKIYVIGGQKGIDGNSSMFTTSYSYDPATNVWKRLADFSPERSHLSPNTIVVAGKIYTFGGEQYFNKELSEVLEYNPATNTFRKLTSMPGARGAGAAGYVGGKFVFTGGKNNGFFSDTYIGTFI